MLARGDKVDFVTITSHEALPDFASTEAVWRDAWSKLYAALKRKQPSLEYMIVPEKHKDSRMHVHAVWNAGVSQKWLKDNARKRGLGYQAKVVSISESAPAVRYITKYIGKDLGEDVPAHFRRVRVSRGWADISPPVNEYASLRWEYIGSNGALNEVYKECHARNVALIDLETGEYCDDIDLGTIVAYSIG